MTLQEVSNSFHSITIISTLSLADFYITKLVISYYYGSKPHASWRRYSFPTKNTKQNKKRLNSFYRMILWYDSHLIWTLLVFFFQFSSENCDPSISCLEGEDILNPRTQVIPRFDQGHKLSWQLKKQSFSFWLMLSQWEANLDLIA